MVIACYLSATGRNRAPRLCGIAWRRSCCAQRSEMIPDVLKVNSVTGLKNKDDFLMHGVVLQIRMFGVRGLTGRGSTGACGPSRLIQYFVVQRGRATSHAQGIAGVLRLTGTGHPGI